MYADDTQLYLSFRPNNNHGEDDALKAMELCVQDIRVWLSRDKLFMNDKKTGFLVTGTRRQLQKVSIDCLTTGAEKILVAEKPLKNLGVWLDSKLSMDAHITKACSAAFYYFYNIRRIPCYLPKESSERVIHQDWIIVTVCSTIFQQYSSITTRKTAENPKYCRKNHLTRKQILPCHSTSYDFALAATKL